VPEVQTEETVRAFSGTLRRISGGVDVSFDPLTASATAAAAIRVEDLNVLALIFSFDADVVWLEILLLAPDENPRTPLLFCLPVNRRQASRATLSVLNRIFAIGILCD